MLNQNYKLSDYKSFVLEDSILQTFFNDLEGWNKINYWGKPKISSYNTWLNQSNLFDNKKRRPTKLAEILQNHYFEDRLFVWQIIWINLSYNSGIIRWYLNEINWDATILVKDMIYRLKSTTKRTDDYVKRRVTELVKLFSKSTLGADIGMGVVNDMKNSSGENIRKISKNSTDNLNPNTILYSLYKHASENHKYILRLSDFYKKDRFSGFYYQFGITKSKLEKILRGLQEAKSNFINVELSKGLDNIYLNDKFEIKEILS